MKSKINKSSYWLKSQNVTVLVDTKINNVMFHNSGRKLLIFKPISAPFRVRVKYTFTYC